MLPIIVGYLIWLRRNEVAQLPVSSNRSGFVLIVFALLFYFAGFRANNFYGGGWKAFSAVAPGCLPG